MVTVNTYSPLWFETFARTVDAAQTHSEVAFIARQMPREGFPRLLDVCCGEGRHAAALARLGYRVMGIDRDAGAIDVARRECPPEVRLYTMDMREVGRLGEPFDGVICMWQSFGYFDEAGNAALLADLLEIVRPGGRLLLDVYNADFFSTRQGTRRFERAGREVVEEKRLSAGRLQVSVRYGGEVPADTFDWQIFAPAQLAAALADAGWNLLTSCRDFDESLPPAPDHPRMQLLAERPTAGR